MIGAVPAITIKAMLEGMRAIGLDTERMLQRSGLPTDDVNETGGRIPDALYEAIWREARAQSRVESVGVAVGSAVPVGMLGTVDYLASSAANVEESLICARDFGYLTSESSYLEIESGSSGELVVRLVNALPGEEDDVGDEFVMGLVWERLARRASAPIRLVEVQLTRCKPSAPLTERFFGRVSYAHARSQLVLGPGAAGTRLQSADPRLHATLRSLLLEAGKGPSRQWSMTSSIRDCLRSLLVGGTIPTIAILSQALGVSGRTLQRRLAAEGTSFERSLDDVRKELALRNVRARDGLSLLDVAVSIGFADERAFSRAFRRWTGVSPRQWRKAL